MLFFYSLFTLLFRLSQCATVVVDGVSQWKNPQLQVGDSVIFEQKYEYKLYIFRNQRAFSLCNFSEATILTKPNSTSYVWHTSRPGIFFFSFNNGSDTACLDGQKIAFKVLLSPPPNQAASPQVPAPTAAPPLSSRSIPATPPVGSGSIVASSPAFPWPFQPRESNSPSPAPSLMLPATSPMVPDKEGLPFINSNPAVPLPTGEVDSATIRPLPTSGDQPSAQVVGFSAVAQRALSCALLLMIV